MLRPMFDHAIKVDDHVTLKKKVAKTALKPRTISFHGGEDDVTIDHSVTYTLQVGDFCMEVPSTEPKEEEVRPTFRTLCMWIQIGSLPILIGSVMQSSLSDPAILKR